MERYRRASIRRASEERKIDFKTRLIRQSVVCMVIFSAVFIIGLLKTDTAVNISEKIQNSISYTVDYEATVRNIVSAINEFTRGPQNDDTSEADKTD